MASTSPTAPQFGTTRGAVFGARSGGISQAPTHAQTFIDVAFRRTCYTFAWLVILLVAFIVLRIALVAVPAMQHYGIGFLSGRVWDPNAGRYGILAEIWGTLYTSVLALIVGTAFGTAAAIFMSEGYAGKAAFSILRSLGLHLRPGWGRLPDRLENLLNYLKKHSVLE